MSKQERRARHLSGAATLLPATPLKLPTSGAQAAVASEQPVAAATNTQPVDVVAADRYAVFCNPGPGNYRGPLLSRRGGLLPVGATVSLPARLHEEARLNGLQFVRWARGSE